MSEDGPLLAPEKASTEMKKALVRMEMGNLLKEKGAYQILIGEFISYKKGYLEKGKGLIKNGKGTHQKRKRGSSKTEKGHLLQRQSGSY